MNEGKILIHIKEINLKKKFQLKLPFRGPRSGGWGGEEFQGSVSSSAVCHVDQGTDRGGSVLMPSL